MRRAFLLSMDAIVAIGLIFLLASFVIALSATHSSPELEYQRFYYSGKDVMTVLEKARVSSVMDLMPENFTEDCNISDDDMEKSILDALGYMWAQNSTQMSECAENLTRGVLNRTLPKGFGYEVLIDDVSIYKQGEVNGYLSRLHTIVSGYELGKPVSGYFASAYIARMARSTSSYVYFGGYEGDGNITKVFTLPDDANVTEAYMEANIGYNFTLYVNGNDLGEFYSRTANFTANNWTLCSGYASCGSIFNKGGNVATLNFSDFINPFVGGGFIRVTYNTSKPDTRGIFSVSNKTNEDNYWFPGITGIINLFSGFRVPGTLNNLTLHVRYNNNITVNDTGIPVYLIIGDTEIFRKNDSGVVQVDLSDTQMRSLLNYTLLSDTTTPIRFGMETFHVLAGVGSSDVVLITDRSGSMDTCDVWSNESYDCAGELTCTDSNDERCSITCDYDQNICENVCGGTWTWASTVYLCQGETDRCCDSEDMCKNQCGGIYGKRDRINVAKDADLDFIGTIMGFEGSRAGLSAYGNDVCSYDDVTYNQTLLESSVNGYDSDCGGTCICCGINKAVDLITESRSINVLENSGFTGPSKEHWDETGVVNLSRQGAGVDTLEFEGPDNIAEPDIIHVSGNVYAVAYEHTSDSQGYLKTFTIDSSGSIGAVVDSFVFDGSQGEYPDIIHVSGDIFAIAYRGPSEDGWVMTVDIDSLGNIGSQQDNHEFVNSADLNGVGIVHVTGDVYAVVYSDNNWFWDNGYITTFNIDSSGNIGANTDTLEFDSRCTDFDVINASGGIFAIAYSGSGSDGWLATVDIDSSGNIGSVQDSYEFETANTYEPSIVRVSGGVYAVAYRLGSDDSGWVKTLRIQPGGAISQTHIDDFEFDASGCYMPSMTTMHGDYYAIAYRGADDDGWMRVLEMDDEGEINDEVIDEIEFQASDTLSPSIINASGDIYAIAYRYDSDDDGYVTTVSAGNRTLGLYDYWYVSSDHTAYGSLYQNFTMPTGGLISVFLTLEHGTLDSYFDGTADVYCNLTYPEPSGGGYDITEVTVWSESWNSGSNPVGAVKEEINITDYITLMDFNYTVECGADVTGGGGTTMVAFDNIILNTSMDRYNAILVMSDGEATRYCSSFDDYTGEGGSSVDQIDEDWAINSSCNARDQGIAVYSVAFGEGADTIVMQKIACWNCSANDWYPGEEEENCTRYFQSNNAEELEDMYKNIAQQMGQASYEAQAINVTGAVSLENALYPESYLRYNYTPHATLDYGEASIAIESDRFGGDVETPKYGSFYIPSGSRVLDAHVTSYSSMYWTSSVGLNTSRTGGVWTNVYNVSRYGYEYTETGDPFIVNLPSNMLSVAEDNLVSVDTALAADSPTGGSPYDRVIYHAAVESLVGYGDAYFTLENATEDAIDRLEDKLSEFDITALEIVTPHLYISELPSLWGPSIMEIRVWS